MDTTSSLDSGCPVLSYSPHERRPIGEWAAFFDQLRADAPVVRNTFAGGYYVLTRYEDILGAYQDPETFTNNAVTVFEPDPSYRWIPHMLGGDEHRQWRRRLGPYFSPKAIGGLDARIRGWADRVTRYSTSPASATSKASGFRSNVVSCSGPR